MFLEQIRSNDGTGTLSYLIADERSSVCALIDPNLNDLETLSSRILSGGFRLEFVIDTHTHADHRSAAGELHKRFGATVVMHENTVHKWKVVDQGAQFGIGDILRDNAAIEVQRHVPDREIVRLGSLEIAMLHTPGHTDNHICPLVAGHLFTGDLLLIGQAGRSDLPGGNTAQQYESLFSKILTLPDDTFIHPGHDYEGKSVTTLEEEKAHNPFLQQRTLEEYTAFVADFFPPLADTTADGTATLQCGVKRVSDHDEAFRHVTPQEVARKLDAGEEPFLLDVREPFELTAFGAIPGVINIPSRQVKNRLHELPSDREIVVVCQSGNRSVEVANMLVRAGFPRVSNLQGGTSRWARSRLPLGRPTPPARTARKVWGRG